jgi:UDP-N-acetylglucosamine 2-epimerase (non-hydrolysing)/GDP/UDP-N,N'-diacetylbacillosamine 2-epimerase (hydrolysing)
MSGVNHSAPRRICVFTGARAEYGLLRWTMAELRDRPDVVLQVLVAGAHLSPEYGMTCQSIADDSFEIDERVEMLVSSVTSVGVAKSLGLGVIGFADALTRLSPEVLVVLGDRYEALAVATTAMLLRIPIAHIAGGESTEGAFDESIRHAITKMAHLHFVATDEFRDRVIQLGEPPERVMTVGAPGLDGVEKLRLMSVTEIEDELRLPPGRPLLVVTYHPVTAVGHDPAAGVHSLLAGLDTIPDATVVFTQPNADTAAARITDAMQSYVLRAPERARIFAALGQRRYLSLLSCADAVIGNSSSGLIEAPAVGTPTVNIGDRQRGRPRAASVIDCPEEPSAIGAAVRRALSPAMRRRAAASESPYGRGGAARRIATALCEADLVSLLRKSLHAVRPGSPPDRTEYVVREDLSRTRHQGSGR